MSASQFTTVPDEGGVLDEIEDFSVAVGTHRDRPCIVVTGEIDLATVPHLHAAVGQLLAEGHHDLVVDLGPVTFVDGSVLRFLLTAERDTRQAGGSLQVVGVSQQLRRLWNVTGLTESHPDLVRADAGAGEGDRQRSIQR